MNFLRKRSVAYIISAVIVIFSVIIMMLGDEPEVVSSEQVAQMPQAAPTPAPTPSPTPSPTPAPTPTPVRPTTLGLTLSQILDAVADTPGYIRTFDLEDGLQVTEKVFSSSAHKLFVYHSEETAYATTIILSVSASATINNRVLQGVNDTYETILSLLPSDVSGRMTSGNQTFGDYRMFLLSVEHSADFDFGTLRFYTPEMALTDFFASPENAEQYTRLVRAGDFQGLYDFLMAHVENNNAQPYDSAWIILDFLAPKLEMLDRITIVYDAFDDVATIFYRGLENVSSHHSFVPNTTTVNNGMRAIIGFHNDTFINVLNGRLRLENGDTLSVGMTNAIRDTISENEVSEHVHYTMGTRYWVYRLARSRPYMIRFEGTQGRSLERVLTPEEQNAFEVVYVFQNTNVFPNFLFAWNRH